jgi:hypothetical protein
MSFNPLSVPAQNYIGAIPRFPMQLCVPTKEAPAYALVQITWENYGVSLSNPNAAVSLDLRGTQTNAIARQLSGIRGVYIDNQNSDLSITVYFPDTQFAITCPPYSTNWQPVVTNDMRCTVFGFGATTNDPSQTNIYLFNVGVNPGVSNQINYTYPQYRCSPNFSRGLNQFTNGFASPAIGDQWQYVSTSIANLNKSYTAGLFGTPYVQGGIITLTDISLQYSINTSAIANRIVTAGIYSNGLGGTFFAHSFSDTNITNAVFLQKNNTQFKLNAAETWTFNLTLNTATGANVGGLYTAHFGFSYNGSSNTQIVSQFGTAQSIPAGAGSQDISAATPYDGIRFQAATNTNILNVQIGTNNGGGYSYHLELWNDAAGNPGQFIMASDSLIIPNGISPTMFQFNFSTPAPISLNTYYWLVLVPDDPTLASAKWYQIASIAGYQSSVPRASIPTLNNSAAVALIFQARCLSS